MNFQVGDTVRVINQRPGFYGGCMVGEVGVINKIVGGRVVLDLTRFSGAVWNVRDYEIEMVVPDDDELYY